MRSIELHWLSKKEKDITLPNIIFEDGGDYGACYYSSLKNREIFYHPEIEINGKNHDCTKGLIVINTSTYEANNEKNYIENAIAHEWRHHCQKLRNITDEHFLKLDWLDYKKYKENIIKYFLTYPTEMDALIYSQRIAPCETDREWLSWIKKFKGINKCGLL